MPLNTKAITIGSLAAAAATGIAAAQAGTANTPLTLSGSLVTAGVATMDVARRVIVTSGGNDTGITFKIVGTDRYGRPQTEILTGASGAAAQTAHDFLTVTSITPSGNVATTASAGTNGVASSDAYIVDWVPNGNVMGLSTLVSGTISYTMEECRDDYAPAWDQANNTFTWFPDSTFTASTTSQAGNLQGPFTAVRITVNSGTGSVTGKFITPFIGGAI